MIYYNNSIQSGAIQPFNKIEESNSIDSEQPISEVIPCCSEIDNVTTSLQKSIGDPLSGLSLKTLSIVEEAIALLEGLCAAGKEIEFIQAEIRHVGFQLEDWQKALQNRDLHSIAYKEYEKSSSFQNTQRLSILRQEATELQERLPALRNRWEHLIENLRIEGHDEYFPQIQAHIEKVLQKIPSLKAFKQTIFKQKFPQKKESLFTDLPHPKRSWLTRALRTFCHSEEWSDTTKDLVYRGFALMQISAANLFQARPATDEIQCPTYKLYCDESDLQSSLNYFCEPGRHSVYSPVVGSRVNELRGVKKLMKAESLVKNFENSLYQPENIELVPRECKVIADEVANQMFSDYLDRYRHCGVTEQNAVDWSDNDFRLGVTYIIDIENKWNTWNIYKVSEHEIFENAVKELLKGT